MVGSIRTFPTADSPCFSFGECSRGSILSSKQVLSHSREQDDMDRVLHALADASRRVTVERLSKGPASVGELARPLAMSLPPVIQHTQVLEASGLVRSKKV